MQLHSLMLMDDTAILGSSKRILVLRLKALEKYCDLYKMIINEGKTKFMVINGSDEDKLPIHLNKLTVKHTQSYIYLGSPISETGSMKNDLQRHANLNFKQLNKFIIFCKNNDEMPYEFKKKVFDAVITSKLLYGCEAWLCEKFIKIDALHMSAVKALLGVRKQTRNDVTLVEGGINNVTKIVNERRNNFLKKKLVDEEEPLSIVYNLCKRANTRGYQLLSKSNDVRAENTIEVTKERITADENSSKLRTYKSINPHLSVHEVYHARKDKHIMDYKRVEFTRFRTSTHRLYIERGRWSRVPSEQRLCRCNRRNVEDEEHVTLNCEITNDLRARYDIRGYTNLEMLFTKHNKYELVDFIFEVMKRFK